MSNWLYKGEDILNKEDLPTNTYGFIYITTHIPTGKKYLGKKSLYHNLNVKLGKKELLALPISKGRKPTTKKVIKESDWITYYGSEESIKKNIKEKKQSEYSREIIQIVYNKKLLTYFECKYQFTFGVLESDEWINYNILAKFFTKDFEV